MRKENVVFISISVLLTSALAVVVYFSQAWSLAAMEQQQLFMYDWGYLTDLLKRGGIGLITARFAVQFFVNPVASSCITALLLGGSAWMLWRTVSRFVSIPEFYPLCWTPSLVVACLLRVPEASFLPVTRLFLASLLLVLASSAFKPKSRSETSTFHIFAASTIGCAVLIAFLTIYPKVANPAYDELCRLEYLTINERYEELIDNVPKRALSPGELNYVNHALAETGRLGDELFSVRQNSPFGLFTYADGYENMPLSAHVLYSMGDMAAAEEVAFNAFQAKYGYNPSMLKLLSKVEMMRGCHETASKYLDLLSKSLYYRKWAKQYLHHLQDGSPVEEIERGSRNMHGDDGYLVMSVSLFSDLVNIVRTNPSDVKAAEYALSFLLLAKDFTGVRDFIAEFWGKPCLLRLPKHAQEALVFFYDYFHTMDESYAASLGIDHQTYSDYLSTDFLWCCNHGLEKETIDRFEQFKSSSSMNGFRNTFWYYLLYEKID